MKKHGGGVPAFFDPAACGTDAQSRKHYRHGIPLCEPCRLATNRRKQDWREANREHCREYDRAWKRKQRARAS